MEQGQAVQVATTDVELERAIASVPGVVSAGIDRSASTGKSRMRLRLAPGEDEEAVAWAVAATLRERFGIALDPDAIRPRTAGSADPEHDPERDPERDPVRVVRRFERGGASPDADPARSRSDGPSAEVGDPRTRLANELADTRERLRLAAARALDGLSDLDDVDDLDGVAEVVDMAELLDDAGQGRVPAASAAPTVDGEPLQAPEARGPEARDLPARTVIPRAAIRDLQVHRDARSVQVTVVLGHGDRVEEGRAGSVPTSHGTLRAVAEATVAALRALTEGSLLVGIDRITAKQGEDSPVATVVLSLLTRRGEERLLGASIIHDSPERAVLRATLDALNRRVMPLLLERDAAFDVPS